MKDKKNVENKEGSKHWWWKFLSNHQEPQTEDMFLILYEDEILCCLINVPIIYVCVCVKRKSL